jgi:hypothetical protein
VVFRTKHEDAAVKMEFAAGWPFWTECMMYGVQ